jgi:hypothetical protein
MVAFNRNEVFYLFSVFHSRHYMFRPVRAGPSSGEHYRPARKEKACSDLSEIEKNK